MLIIAVLRILRPVVEPRFSIFRPECNLALRRPRTGSLTGSTGNEWARRLHLPHSDSVDTPTYRLQRHANAAQMSP